MPGTASLMTLESDDTSRLAAPGGPIGLNAALATGLYPFIVKDFIKVSIASGVLPTVWKIVAPAKES